MITFFWYTRPYSNNQHFHTVKCVFLCVFTGFLPATNHSHLHKKALPLVFHQTFVVLTRYHGMHPLHLGIMDIMGYNVVDLSDDGTLQIPNFNPIWCKKNISFYLGNIFQDQKKSWLSLRSVSFAPDLSWNTWLQSCNDQDVSLPRRLPPGQGLEFDHHSILGLSL